MNRILIVAVISIILFSVLILRKMRKRRTAPDAAAVNISNLDEMVLYAVASCRDITCNALCSLAQAEVNHACENHRKGFEKLSKIERETRRLLCGGTSEYELKVVYLNYMIEAAEKVAETSRHIVIRPSFSISISDKCEIQAVCRMFEDMFDIFDDKSRQMEDKVKNASNNKDFIEHLIAVRSKAMRYEDFNEETLAYSYLTLLYYLHSLVNSYCRLISTSSK